MPVYVAKIRRYDEGTFAYAFEAAHDDDAQIIAENDILQPERDADGNLVEELEQVMPIEDFLNGMVYELCMT